MYVLVRLDGMFALPPGQAMSYTKDLTKAWRFATKEQADGQRCRDNERVASLESLLQPPETMRRNVS